MKRKKGKWNNQSQKNSFIIHALWFNKTNQFSPLRLSLSMTFLIYRNMLIIIRVNGFGTAWGGVFFEKSLKLWVLIYTNYRICFKNPRSVSHKIPLPWVAGKSTKCSYIPKIRQNSFGAVSPHSSPSCLPGKTFYLHFCCDTVAVALCTHIYLL